MKQRKSNVGWSLLSQNERLIETPKKALVKCFNHILHESLKALDIEKREDMTWKNH